MSRRIAVGASLSLMGLALALLATGWTVVEPGEAVVVRRLGRVLPQPWGPGLHYAWPVGLDTRVRVRTDEVRRLSLGRGDGGASWDEPGSGEYLTGDLNLLRAGATVQYRVRDPVAFTLRTGDVEPVLRRLGEAALSRALARQGVDATLGEGRIAASDETRRAIEAGEARYGLGVEVLGVSLTEARPPSEVAADFAAAQSARSEAERRVTEARTYERSTAVQAQSQARARNDAARARAERTVALAGARAQRFLALRSELERARTLTLRRIYLDTLRDLLPRVGRTLVVAPEEPVDLSLIENGR